MTQTSGSLVHVNVAMTLAALLAAGSVVTRAAEDWPSFRGPTGQGHSVEEGLPVEWSEDANVTWKVDVPGLGWSSPVVADGRVWLTTGENGALRLLAYDAQSGESLVDVDVFSTDDRFAPNPKNSLASPTAVIDSVRDRVYVHFGAYGTAALTTDGDVVWSTRFPYVTQHGNGGSPVLYEDLLIFSCDGYDQAFVIALDVDTGDVRWKTDRPDPISQAYSTPAIIEVDGHDQLISIGAFRTSAYDPRTGDEIWRVGYPNGFSNVPGPVYSAEHGLVYISTGFQQPTLLAVGVDGQGDVTRTHVAWRLRRGAPHTPSPIVVGDEVYVVSDRGILTCADAATGEVHWQDRLRGNFSASPVYVDDRLYFQSEEGETIVLRPSAESYQEIARNELDGSTLATLAVSDGSFFIRTDSSLYRITAG